MSAEPLWVGEEAAVPSRFEVGFVSVGGVYRRGGLAQCWSEPFERALPVRKFVSYKGQKNFTGWRWVATTGRHVGFESWLERDNLTVLDFDPEVTAVSSQPFVLFWHDGAKERKHIPDYFARLRDGAGLVVDVKPDLRIKPEHAAAFAITRRMCRDVGWEYARVGKFDPVSLANLRWLAGYRHPRNAGVPGLAEKVLAAFSDPTPLFDGAGAAGPLLASLPTTYHLLWRQALRMDLGSACLNHRSLVWADRGAPPVGLSEGEGVFRSRSRGLWRGARVVPEPGSALNLLGEASGSTLVRPGRISMGNSAYVLRVGDRVRWQETLHTVTALDGAEVTLTDGHGSSVQVWLVELQLRGALGDLGERPRRLASGSLALLPDEVLTQARWWEGHVVEVLTGVAPGSDPKAAPRPQYDPATHSLAQREAAKAEELSAQGREAVSAGTVKRKRLRYEARGLEGLVDWRAEPRRKDRVDERVGAALRKVIEQTEQESSRTATFLMWETEQELIAQYGAGTVQMPPRATFFRLLARLSQGTHATGSARTRRSMASQPSGSFGVYTLVRPGELMEIDSTPLDVAVRLHNGVVGRVELTGLIDVATRTVTAAVLRPTTKAVDASLLLARSVTPELMRPGWVEALRMSRSVLPYRSLLSVDDRVRGAAAHPVIVPEVIVCDQGKAFVSDNFRASCQQLGIDFQPAPPADPTKKPHIERFMGSVGTLFAQYVSGYLGSSTERRGYQVERRDQLWSLQELQELLDEWIVAKWQNRPHDGLRDPLAPGRTFTPNEKYAALVRAAGYVPVALGAQDYIELLPTTWRAVNHYGVKIGHRVYDAELLGPMRRQGSGVEAKRGLWEVHRDPYDITRIWLRDHWNGGGWITLFWKLLRGAPAPFGQLAWDHAAADLRARGGNPTEQEIADAVQGLLARAHKGPEPQPGAGQRRGRGPSKRDQRVAGRTEAVGSSLPAQVVALRQEPAPVSHGEGLDPTHEVAEGAGAQEGDESLAEVVPLGVFDAQKESRKWW